MMSLVFLLALSPRALAVAIPPAVQGNNNSTCGGNGTYHYPGHHHHGQRPHHFNGTCGNHTGANDTWHPDHWKSTRAEPVPVLIDRQTMYGNWTKVTCTSYGVTDAAMAANLRWSAVGAEGAWEEVNNAWNNEPPPAGDVQLPYPEWLMNYFHGPDNWDCQDINDGACSPGVLQCGDTNYPAGWFVMNSLANIHDIHKEIYNSLTTAQTQMQSQMGTFASTFAPVESDNGIEVLKEILDAAAFVVGGSSAFFWNKVAESIAKVWQNSGDKGFSKDVFNAAIAYVINANKDALSEAAKQLEQQNSLSSAMGLYFEAWRQAQATFVRDIFSGAAQTLPDLGRMVRDGQMDWPQGSGPDFQDYVGEAQKLVYAQLIPKAWQNSATTRYPIVLESTDPCTSSAGDQVKDYMSDDTAAATHMCMNDRIYYLVNAKIPTADPPGCANLLTCPHHDIFEPLPGGTFDNLSGGGWGGVRIDDIVIASYKGWQSNGNKNGWGVPDFASQIEGGASAFDLFGDGIQTAGFNSIPFCSVDNLDEIAGRILANNQVHGPYWPCE